MRKFIYFVLMYVFYYRLIPWFAFQCTLNNLLSISNNWLRYQHQPSLAIKINRHNIRQICELCKPGNALLSQCEHALQSVITIKSWKLRECFSKIVLYFFIVCCLNIIRKWFVKLNCKLKTFKKKLTVEDGGPTIQVIWP